MRALPIAAVLLVVSGCGEQDALRISFPPNADLKVAPKPVPSDDIVTSEAAADAYDASLESWGEAACRQTARLCRWASAMGAPVTCPPPTSGICGVGTGAGR